MKKKMEYQWKIRTEFQTRKTLSFWVVKLGSALPKNRKFGAKHLGCRAIFFSPSEWSFIIDIIHFLLKNSRKLIH